MDSTRIRELLKKVSIFANIDDLALGRLASLVQVREVGRDSLIFGQDDSGDALFIIASGRVKVVLYGENGKEITLTFFGEGDFFGEMSLLDDMPRSANVITCEVSTLVILKRSDFVTHLEESPATAINVLGELSRRLRKADGIIGNLALLDVYGRLARLLMDLAEKDGEKVEGGTLIRKRPTQQDLASMANTSRETVSRVLGDFQKRGLLEMDGKRVVLRPHFFHEHG